MNILETLIQLRDDLKTWVTNNLVALNAKIESKTITVDNELKADSTNPVQNKIIKAKTDELANAISTLDNVIETIQNNIDNITDDGSGEFNIADPNGNVIFKVNKDGIHATNINTNGDNFTISDASGNVIFKVDAEGAHTTDVTVDGISIKAKMPEWDAKSNFSGDYNDLINAPNITDDGSDEYIIVDEAGNIIFKVDAAGAHTTEINLSGTNVKDTLESLAGDIEDIETVKIPDLNAELAAHKADTNNPHEVAFKQLKDSNIIDDESGEVVYADSNGNIIAKIDANGLKTTKVNANSVEIDGKNVTTVMDEKDDAVRSDLTAHVKNTNIHITSSEREAWNAKADKSDIDEAVANLVDSSPETLNTLNELAAALDNDPSFAATVAEQIGQKANASDLVAIEEQIGQKANTADLANVATTGDYEDLNNAPAIAEDESAELNIVDDDGNIIAKINEDGIHSTSLALKNPLKIENGGTGNPNGRVQIGQKEGENLGSNATSEGYYTTASGDCSHAEGLYTTASGDRSHSEGLYTTASGDCSHAEGARSIARGAGSHAEGNSFADGSYAHAEGSSGVYQVNLTGSNGTYTYDTSASPGLEGIAGEDMIFIDNSIYTVITVNKESNELTLNDYPIDVQWDNKIGYLVDSGAWGSYSHAEGNNTTASGIYSHAEGLLTTASGYSSHAEGTGAIASGQESHAEGEYTEASGNYSHAEGNHTDAFGECSHAEGFRTSAQGDYSHVEGYDSGALGNYSHAEGYASFAQEECSHAEGYHSTASGKYSHAEGYNCAASGQYSHAQNLKTEAKGESQTAIGKYNVTDTTSAFIIGNGSNSENKSNAYTVDWDGNTVQAGNMTAQGIIMLSCYGTETPEQYFANNNLTPVQGQIYIQILE